MAGEACENLVTLDGPCPALQERLLVPVNATSCFPVFFSPTQHLGVGVPGN